MGLKIDFTSAPLTWLKGIQSAAGLQCIVVMAQVYVFHSPPMASQDAWASQWHQCPLPKQSGWALHAPSSTSTQGMPARQVRGHTVRAGQSIGLYYIRFHYISHDRETAEARRVAGAAVRTRPRSPSLACSRPRPCMASSFWPSCHRAWPGRTRNTSQHGPAPWLPGSRTLWWRCRSRARPHAAGPCGRRRPRSPSHVRMSSPSRSRSPPCSSAAWGIRSSFRGCGSRIPSIWPHRGAHADHTAPPRPAWVGSPPHPCKASSSWPRGRKGRLGRRRSKPQPRGQGRRTSSAHAPERHRSWLLAHLAQAHGSSSPKSRSLHHRSTTPPRRRPVHRPPCGCT